MRPFITKQTTKFRAPIPAEERLAVTLRYLATGKIYKSLMYQFRIHRTTISQIIQEVGSGHLQSITTRLHEAAIFYPRMESYC